MSHVFCCSNSQLTNTVGPWNLVLHLCVVNYLNKNQNFTPQQHPPLTMDNSLNFPPHSQVIDSKSHTHHAFDFILIHVDTIFIYFHKIAINRYLHVQVHYMYTLNILNLKIQNVPKSEIFEVPI